MLLIFKESKAFERSREEHLDDEEFRALQSALLDNPEAGVLIRRTGGLRKLRWNAEGTGKRGGLRIIYYLAWALESCLLLIVYRKGAQDDLTPEQERVLMRLVQNELDAGGK
jgi:mRNA-degrading endonuclease RelE of RelBE toxin-antitoxin system